MSWGDCLSAIRNVIGRDLTDEEDRILYEQFTQSFENIRRQQEFDDLESAAMQAAEEVSAQTQLMALQKRADKALWIIEEQKIFNRITTHFDDNISAGVRAWQGGQHRAVPGSQKGFGTRHAVIRDGHQAHLFAELRRPGEDRTVEDTMWKKTTGTIDEQDQIARAIKIADGVENVRSDDLSPEDLRVGQAFHNMFESLWALQKRSGGGGIKREDWVSIQTHSQPRIARAFEKPNERADYVRDTMEELDETTFTGRWANDPEGYVRAAATGFSSGVHIKHGEAAGGDPLVYHTPGNIIDRINLPRKYIFKSQDGDSKAWLRYNKKYGSDNLYNSIMESLEYKSKQIAMLQHFRGSPQANRQRLINRLENYLSEKAQTADTPEQRRNYSAQLRELGMQERGAGAPKNTTGGQWATITGANRAGVMSRLGIGLGVAKTLTNFQLLPTSNISMMTDWTFGASALTDTAGHNMLSGVFGAMSSWLKTTNTGDVRKLAAATGAGLDMDRFTALSKFDMTMDDVPGKIARAETLFHKYVSIMTPLSDRHKMYIHGQIASFMHSSRDLEWGQLNADMRREMIKSDLTPEKWDIIRRLPTNEADGHSYLDFDEIQNLPDEAFTPLLEGQRPTPTRIQRLKDSLQADALEYIYVNVERGNLRVDLNTEATIRGTNEANTPGGMFRTLFFHLKSFPIRVIQGPMQHSIYGRGSRTAAEAFTGTPLGFAIGGGGLRERWARTGLLAQPGAPSFMGLAVGPNAELYYLGRSIATATLLGYAAMSVKDILKGREPRDPRDQRTWIAAMLQGGALGIYGDFLFGELKSRYGGGAIKTLAGPVPGKLEDILDLYARWRDGDPLASNALQFILRQTPNVYGTKLMLDYYILWDIEEWLNPGILERRRQRVERELGTEWLLPPQAR